MLLIKIQMGIYSQIHSSVTVTPHHESSDLLQEESSESASGEGATDLEVGSSASELSGRSRVRSSARGGSGAGRLTSTLNGLGGLGGVASANDGRNTNSSGGVGSWACHSMGGRGRGSVLGQKRSDSNGHNGGTGLLSNGGGAVVGRRNCGESGDGSEELHVD